MLTNLESQLKQQSAAHRLDEVLAEIPACARTSASSAGDPDLADCRHRAVLNVLTGERYKTIAKETAGILKGEYGRTPAPVNAALQARVLDGADPVTCRPADLLKPELAQLEADVRRRAQEKGITLAENAIDDVLTVALFPQPCLKFLETATTRQPLSRYRRRKPRSQWQKQKNLPPPASTPWRWKAKPLWSKSATAVTSAS